MNRRTFLKSMFIFGAGAWVAKNGIYRPSPADARGLMVVGGGVPAAAPPAYEIEDNFNDNNYTGWTVRTGTFSAATGYLIATILDGNGEAYISNDTALSSANHWVKAQAVGYRIYMALSFRLDTTTGNGYMMQIRKDSDGDPVIIRVTNWAWVANLGTVSSAAAWDNLANGQWIGIEVSGTGAATKVDAWIWATDPGARTNWGAATSTLTFNYTYNAGTRVGLTLDDVGTGKWDNFTANAS